MYIYIYFLHTWLNLYLYTYIYIRMFQDCSTYVPVLFHECSRNVEGMCVTNMCQACSKVRGMLQVRSRCVFIKIRLQEWWRNVSDVFKNLLCQACSHTAVPRRHICMFHLCSRWSRNCPGMFQECSRIAFAITDLYISDSKTLEKISDHKIGKAGESSQRTMPAASNSGGENPSFPSQHRTARHPPPPNPPTPKSNRPPPNPAHPCSWWADESVRLKSSNLHQNHESTLISPSMIQECSSSVPGMFQECFWTIPGMFKTSQVGFITATNMA